MKFEITIIGSGDTLGTPVAGTNNATCNDPKSKRYRFGLLITINNKKILIDTNPDLKWQCLDNHFQLKDIDYILITHSHSDHLNGMGEFFCRRDNPTIVYSLNHPLIQKHMEYFKYLTNEGVLNFETCTPYQEITLDKDIKIIPIELNHGFPAIGYVINFSNKKIAIMSDSNKNLSSQTIEALNGVDALFIDAFSEDMEQVKEVYKTCNIPIPSDIHEGWYHMTFEEAKEIGTKVNAKKIYPVHISQYASPHDELVRKHQTNNFIISFDGMKIIL